MQIESMPQWFAVIRNSASQQMFVQLDRETGF